jgi:hypothetical protein
VRYLAHLGLLLTLFAVAGQPARSSAQPRTRSAKSAASARQVPSAAGPTRVDHVGEAEAFVAQGRHAEAAQKFLDADDVVHDTTKLWRAFDAAQRSADGLLIVRVAERILSRAEVTPEERSLARTAIVQASDGLAQLELVCGERACEFEVDGQPAMEGISYRNPGPHEVRLRGESVVALECAARAICRVSFSAGTPKVLIVGGPSAAKPAAQPALASQSAPSGGAERGPALPRVEREPAHASGPRHHRASSGHVALTTVAITTGVVAVGLAAVATWSGLQAIHGRDRYGASDYDADEVRAWARRTDLLVVGAAASAALSLTTGLLTLRRERRKATSLSAGPGIGLAARHDF